MSADEADRLKSEISLLEAMYPEQVTFNSKARELKFNSEQASFTLRLPAGYLNDELPEVISASFGRRDGREILTRSIREYPVGEEVLDSIIALASENQELRQVEEETSDGISDASHGSSTTEKATVVVWLHHLLNTNKRKQALSPPPSDVSGVTKPGYPGVLVYSGTAASVHEHVSDLRQLNWQAFAVRLERDEERTFQHGEGVKEFETMKEVVADIAKDRKEQFMEAMRMK